MLKNALPGQVIVAPPIANQEPIDLSVIIPALDTVANLSQFLADLQTVLASLQIAYEIIVVGQALQPTTIALAPHSPVILIDPQQPGYGMSRHVISADSRTVGVPPPGCVLPPRKTG